MDKKMMSVCHLSKAFPDRGGMVHVLEDISFALYEGEFLVILGPGYAGKSVLLNMIGGIEKADSGKIEFHMPNLKMSMVFQKISLMNWKTVAQNVAFGLQLHEKRKEYRQEIVRKYIKLVGLEGFEKAYPKQLSGGMKQRVGLARAYAVNPNIILMDEPFGQLDAQTRYAMQSELLEICQKEKKTVVFVTNNIEEALTLGDRIILLSKQPATVKQEYVVNMEKPRKTMSAQFMQLRKEISANTDLAL